MGTADVPAINKKHFEGALKNVRPSLTDQSLDYFENWNDKFGSKIHLSMSALPADMRPYTTEELAEIDRKREEKELAEKAAKEAALRADEEYQIQIHNIVELPCRLCCFLYNWTH